MRSAVLTETETIEVIDRDVPDVGDDEVLVKVGACGVCMSDHHIYSGSFSADDSIVLGHESAGEVVEVGEGVHKFATGDRVTIHPAITCGSCEFCNAGRSHLCEDLVSVGGAGDEIVDGSFAEYVLVPASSVREIGDMAFDRAAFAEPLACCVHGVDRADVTSGDTVGIIGAGPIGLLLTQVFKQDGAGHITVFELKDERRELAAELGADAVVDPREASDEDFEFDVSVEAVGKPQTISDAIEKTKAGGTTLIFGVPPEDVSVEFSPFDIFYREKEIVGTFALNKNAFDRAIVLLQNGRIETEPLISEQLGLDGLETAFDRMERSEGLKKVIYPNGTSMQ